MKTDVTFYDFEDAFRDMDRYDSFGYDGLKALYDYLIEYEDAVGEELSLDVIALCCEYSLYTFEDYVNDYSPDIDRKDYDDDDDYRDAVMDDLRDNTAVIGVDDDSFIIVNF